MTRCLSILILFACLNAGGATWYVDKDATGANDGSTWADAWTSLSSLTAGLSAGDTAYISGGTSGKTYTNGIVLGASGSAVGGRITISVSDDSGHNGFVNLDGLTLEGHGGFISINSRDFITIQGRGAGATTPTNNFQVDSGSTDVRSSIRLWLRNSRAAAGSSGAAIILSGTPNDITIEGVGITNVLRNNAAGQNAYGIWLNQTSGGAISNLVMRYNLITHTDDDGVQGVSNDPATQHAKAEFSYNLVHYVGDDGLEVNHGWSIHNNVLGPSRFLFGHPDGIQSNGSWFKIYNNRIYDFFNSLLRLQSSSLTNWSEVHVFNNLLLPWAPRQAPYVPMTNTVIEIAQYAIGPGGLALQTWSNINITCNTIYSTNADFTGGNIAWSKREDGSLYFHNVIVTNCNFVGNLFFTRNAQRNLDNGGGIPWQAFATVEPWGTLPTYSTEQANVCDFNTIASSGGLGVGQKAITHFGASYSDGETMAASSIWTHNKSTVPVFVSEGVDFEPAPSDTATLNGTNLSALGFTFDIKNRARVAWRRGAFEPQDLIAFYSFDNDTHGGTITDDSGNGRTGYRFNLTEYSYPSNRLASTAAGTLFRPNVTGRCLDNLWRTNNGVYNPLYLDDGSYVVVTNLHNVITNLTYFSWCGWARYYPATRTDKIGADSSSDGNAAWLSFGSTAQGTKGSSAVRRYNHRINQNNTRWVIQTNDGFAGGTSWGDVGNWAIGYGSGNQVFLEYPDRGYDNAGNTTNWYFYAGSWSNGTARTYFSTAPNTISMLTNITFGTMTTLRLGGGLRPYDPVTIGGSAHSGTHQFDGDAYPNDAWMNGVVDNIRLFASVVTHQGFVQIANDDGGEFDDAPAEGGGSTPQAGRVGKLRGIRLR